MRYEKALILFFALILGKACRGVLHHAPELGRGLGHESLDRGSGDGRTGSGAAEHTLVLVAIGQVRLDEVRDQEGPRDQTHEHQGVLPKQAAATRA